MLGGLAPFLSHSVLYANCVPSTKAGEKQKVPWVISGTSMPIYQLTYCEGRRVYEGSHYTSPGRKQPFR